MADAISLDGRTLVGVENDDAGEVDDQTRFHFEQDGQRIRARYAGGVIVAGYLLGVVDGQTWDVRYVQLNKDGETASGHSVGTIRMLDDGRVRVEDEWEWESREGRGESVLEEIKR